MVDRCCGGKGGLGEADAGTYQHVTAAQHEFQLCSGGKIQRLFELNHRHGRLIASTNTAIRFPRGVVGAVDQITDRPFGLLIFLLIGFGKICRRINELSLFPIGTFWLLDQHLDLGDPPHPCGTPARAAEREVTMGECFQTQASHPLQFGLRNQEHIRTGMAAHQQRFVRQLGRMIQTAITSHFDRFQRRPVHLLLQHRLFPRRQFLLPLRMQHGYPCFDRFDRLLPFVNLLLLFCRIDPGLGLVRIVEEGKHAVVLVMTDRVKFVRMALCTLSRQAKDRFSQTIHPIEHFKHAKLFRNNRPFFVQHAVTEKTGRDPLFLSCIGKQVPSNLFDQELVIGQITVQRANHPVSPNPLITCDILFITVGVGIASHIEPMTRPFFAISITL